MTRVSRAKAAGGAQGAEEAHRGHRSRAGAPGGGVRLPGCRGPTTPLRRRSRSRTGAAPHRPGRGHRDHAGRPSRSPWRSASPTTPTPGRIVTAVGRRSRTRRSRGRRPPSRPSAGGEPGFRASPPSRGRRLDAGRRADGHGRRAHRRRRSSGAARAAGWPHTVLPGDAAARPTARAARAAAGCCSTASTSGPRTAVTWTEDGRTSVISAIAVPRGELYDLAGGPPTRGREPPRCAGPPSRLGARGVPRGARRPRQAHAEARRSRWGRGPCALVLSSPVEEAFLRLEARGAPGGPVVSGPARRDPRDADAVVAPRLRPGARPGRWSWSGGCSRRTATRAARRATAATARWRSPPGCCCWSRRSGCWAWWCWRRASSRRPCAAAAWRRPGARRPRPRASGAGPGRRWPARARAWWTAWWALVAPARSACCCCRSRCCATWARAPGGLGTLLTRHARRHGAGGCRPGRSRRPPSAGAALCRRGPPAATAPALRAGPAAGRRPGRDQLGRPRLERRRPHRQRRHRRHPQPGDGGVARRAAGPGGPGAAGRRGRWPAADRVRLGAGVVVRFSALALTAVAVLVVTGVYRALAELGSVGDDRRHRLRPGAARQARPLRGAAVRRRLQPPGRPPPPGARGPGPRPGRPRRGGGAAGERRAPSSALAAALMVSVAVLVSLPPPG